jgi:hypothetical protein
VSPGSVERPLGYTVTASPGGAGCTVPVGDSSCTVTGLVDGIPYSFVAVAATDNGPSLPSESSLVAVPGPPPTPQGDELPTVPQPGEALLLVGGQPAPEPQQESRPRGLHIVGDDFEMNLAGTNGEGRRLRLGPDGVLTLEQGRGLQSRGSGFRPDSPVLVYLDPPLDSDDTSTPDGILLGRFTTGEEGAFTGDVVLPVGIGRGHHVVQFAGVTPGNLRRSMSVGVSVIGPRDRPGPVIDLRVRRGSVAGTVRLSWRPPVDDGGAPVTAYRVRYRKIGEMPAVRATPDTDRLKYTVSGLMPGKRYWLKVRAINEVGRGPFTKNPTWVRIR